MLASLLPLLEGLASESGLMGGLGSSAGGGFEAMAGRLGFAKSFGSQAEMGQAMQRMSDLADVVKRTQATIDANKQSQANHAEQFRQEERTSLYGDPSHQAAQAQLAQQNQSLSQQLSAHQQQLSALSSRMSATQNPVGNSFRRAGTVLAGVTAAQTFGPGLLQQFPGVQAAQNVGGFLAGPTNAAIAGQMAGTAGSLLASPFTGAAKGASIGSIAGPGGAALGAAIGGLAGTVTEISKLPGLLQKWGEGLLTSNRALAQFSPALAAANAETNRRTVLRGFASGQATGGNLADLSNRLQNLYDTVRPIQDFTTNTLANVITDGVEKLTTAVNTLATIHQVLLAVPLIGKYVKTIENVVSAQKTAGQREMPLTTFLDNARNFSADRFKP